MRLTPVEGFGGFEPSITLDQVGNVWVTAHRTYSPQSVSPQDGAPLRGGAWLWLSKDGKSFDSPPGLTPANEYSQFASSASEGDVAVDAKGNVYFVDLAPVGVALTSWKVTGPGAVQATYTTPQLPVPLAIDRPFIAAGGDRTLLLTHLGAGSGSDPLTIRSFVSRDGGRTFEKPTGTGIPNSGHCRPLIDRRDAQRMAIVCVPSAGSDLVTATSTDGGRTWSYGAIKGAHGKGQGANVVFPSLKQTSDGTLYGLTHRFIGGPAPDSVELLLLSSHDMGRSWNVQNVTPEPGIWEDSSIAVAPDGRLAVSGYYRKNKTSAWGFRAATFRPGDRDITSTQVGPVEAYPATESSVPGEYTQAVFGGDGKLRVTYSVRELPQAQPVTELENKFLGSSAVFYAQQR